MKPRVVIGITGGIATGKTLVLREFRRRRIPTLSADDLAHAALKDRGVRRRILRHFGKGILGRGRQIDRTKLGRVVFADRKERRWLESHIHPWVQTHINAFIRKCRGLIAMDIPLLYEAGYAKQMDAVVVVWSSQETQIKRLHRRNSLDRPSALQRIQAQWPLARKLRRADYVVDNSGTLSQLRRQVATLIHDIEHRFGKNA